MLPSRSRRWYQLPIFGSDAIFDAAGTPAITACRHPVDQSGTRDAYVFSAATFVVPWVGAAPRPGLEIAGGAGREIVSIGPNNPNLVDGRAGRRPSSSLDPPARRAGTRAGCFRAGGHAGARRCRPAARDEARAAGPVGGIVAPRIVAEQARRAGQEGRLRRRLRGPGPPGGVPQHRDRADAAAPDPDRRDLLLHHRPGGPDQPVRHHGDRGRAGRLRDGPAVEPLQPAASARAPATSPPTSASSTSPGRRTRRTPRPRLTGSRRRLTGG